MTLTYKEQLLDPRWQQKRLYIFDRDKFTCRYCRDTKSTLHVHHLKYKPNINAWEYGDDDLLTLCVDCHDVIEFCKKEGVIITNTYCITQVDKKSYLIAVTVNERCLVFEFRTGGELNGKQLILALPFYIIDDIYQFTKENTKNG